MPPQKPQAAPDFIPADTPDFIPSGSNETPPSPVQPQGNAIQRAFDEWTNVTPEQERGHSWLTNKAQEFGAGAIQGVGQPFVHPLDTLTSVGHAVAHPIDTLGQAWTNLKEHPAQAAGNLVGGAVLGGVGGEAANVPMRALNLGERFGGYTSPVIPNALQKASKMAEAIRPVGGISPDLESQLATHTPLVKAFAQETGNPLHSQWETGEGFRGLANKGLEHYKTNFSNPVQGEQVSMRTFPEYQGSVSGEGRYTTLGDMEKRLSDINDMQRAAERTAKTTGQQMSADQALGLEKEAGRLRQMLYQEIGKRTGVDPNVIRDMRQSYGQQFNIADTIDAARRARLGQTGASAEMGGSVPYSKTGLIEKAMQGIRGGQQYIADARLRKLIKDIEPQQSQYPQPVFKK